VSRVRLTVSTVRASGPSLLDHQQWRHEHSGFHVPTPRGGKSLTLSVASLNPEKNTSKAIIYRQREWTNDGKQWLPTWPVRAPTQRNNAAGVPKVLQLTRISHKLGELFLSIHHFHHLSFPCCSFLDLDPLTSVISPTLDCLLLSIQRTDLYRTAQLRVQWSCSVEQSATSLAWEHVTGYI